LLILALLLTAADSVGPEYRGDAGNLRLAPPRAEATIVVDGVLDEAVWDRAARLTGFSQYSPADGRPAQHETEIRVWYSSTAIYFGVRAFAPPGTVRASLADRDKLSNEDLVEIFLGTYNDGRQAMVFGVNPLGVQSDGVLTEGSGGGGGRGGGGFGGGGGRGRTDNSPDFFFRSRGRITDYGYQVEIQIPFKTLRYQQGAVQDWGLHVVRQVQQTGHEESWVPARRASQSFLAQSGTLLGLTGLKRGLVMDLNPSLTALAAGSEGSTGWETNRAMEIGGNLRWGVTPNLTINGTANPDFSQIESDASQVVDDPRRALFFQEKRPFFLDGSEQFSTPNSLIYTRRIMAPVAAAKTTGKISGTDVGLLVAVDAKETSISGEDHPLIAAARLQRDLGSQSKLGVVFTNRTDGDFTNRVAGADARIVLGGIWAATAQVAGSYTRDGNESSTAPLWQASLQRSGRSFGLSYSFSGISDEFVASTGFVSRRGLVSTGLVHSLSLYGARGATIERTYLSVYLRGAWDYRDFIEGRGLLEQNLFLTGSVTLEGGWRATATGIIERFRYDPDLFTDYAVERHQGGVVDTVAFAGTPKLDNLDLRLSVDSPRLGPLSFGTQLTVGRDVNYDEWSASSIFALEQSLEFRPTSQLRLDGTYRLQSYLRTSDGSSVRSTHIPRLRMEYQLTRSIFFRVVGEYVSTTRDSLRDDSRSNDPILIKDADDGIYRRALATADNRLRTEFLFSFQPVPGTVFFAGYAGAYDGATRYRFGDLTRSNDGFFLKASYFFRL
jgi:hypothetical protein